MYTKLLEIIKCGFQWNRSATDQIFFAFAHTGEEVGVQWDGTSAIFNFKKAYVTVRRKLLYSIIMKFGILSQMCLNETYSKVHIDQHWFDTFPIQNGLKQGDALYPLLFNLA